MPIPAHKRGPGRPKGSVGTHTLDKIQAREFIRQQVTARLLPLLHAQMDAAMGISHFMLRDPKTGQFQMLTDPDQIAAALNTPGSKEGSTYYIYTKDPSTPAWTDLANRAYDKPIEREETHHTGNLTVTWKTPQSK